MQKGDRVGITRDIRVQNVLHLPGECAEITSEFTMDGANRKGYHIKFGNGDRTVAFEEELCQI